MESVVSLLDLGIDFAPVPGLKTAFEIVQLIWQNVEKASKNKEELKNLMISTVEILRAINHALLRKKVNEHVRDVLHEIEKVLNDIHVFAAEHATMGLFRAMLKNCDVDGRIESFQKRLQYLQMAFNVYVSIVTEAQLGKLLRGQRAILRRLPSPQPLPTRGAQGNLPNNKLHLQRKSRKHTSSHMDNGTVRVEACFTEPCKIKVQGKVPVLTSTYFPQADFSVWGLRNSDTKVIKKDGRFEIVRPNAKNSRSWMWTLVSKIISISRQSPEYPDWKDVVDIVFKDKSAAATWFSWLQAYAHLPSEGSAKLPLPPNHEVIVRKKFDCRMRKTPKTIERQRPGAGNNWTSTLSGHSQNSMAHATHFTYITTSGTQPFATVYRSGDTIVQERYMRADDEEPTTTRRFRFDTEELAQTWYETWKIRALFQSGGNEPVRVELRFKDPRTILSLNRVPVLASALWPEVALHDWGLQASKASVRQTDTGFVVATVRTSWTWVNKGKKITVYIAITSQPDWFDIMEVVFRDKKSSETWFTYLRDYAENLPCSLPPPAEHVIVTNIRVSWMQKTSKAIELLNATSDRWTPIFGTYLSIEEKDTHLAVTSSSLLPHYRFLRDENALVLERKASADHSEVPVSRRYQFGSEAEAKMWYEIWKEHLRKACPPEK